MGLVVGEKGGIVGERIFVCLAIGYQGAKDAFEYWLKLQSYAIY